MTNLVKISNHFVKKKKDAQTRKPVNSTVNTDSSFFGVQMLIKRIDAE